MRKIFFRIVGQKMTNFFEKKHLFDIRIQKAGIRCSFECLKLTSMTWHQIQTAKKERSDINVVFLDLTNAFDFNFIWGSFGYFKLSETITNLVKAYFQYVQFCFTTLGFITAWYLLEICVMAGSTISPLAFTMVMEIMIRDSKWVVGGERLKLITTHRAYMNYMTTNKKPGELVRLEIEG